MRLYLTYFPLFFFNINYNFLRKKYFSAGKHTDYEFNLKLKKAVKTNLKCYNLSKIRVFYIQREIEFTKSSNNYKSNEGISISS